MNFKLNEIYEKVGLNNPFFIRCNHYKNEVRYGSRLNLKHRFPDINFELDKDLHFGKLYRAYFKYSVDNVLALVVNNCAVIYIDSILGKEKLWRFKYNKKKQQTDDDSKVDAIKKIKAAIDSDTYIKNIDKPISINLIRLEIFKNTYKSVTQTSVDFIINKLIQEKFLTEDLYIINKELFDEQLKGLCERVFNYD